ncbi:DNA repair protein RecN [Elusimicrobiota bacterium]
MIIEEISVKNFAIIEDATFSPSENLSVLTGESGAGKSVLLEAIRFLLGAGQPGSGSIRKGAGLMEVSATISKPSKALLNELGQMGIETAPDDAVLIRRTFDANSSRSRGFVQDTPVTITTLKRIGLNFIEIYSQGENQKLYDHDFQQDYLDRWGSLLPLRSEHAQAVRQTNEAQSALEEHLKFVSENATRKEFLASELAELKSAPTDPETLEKIENDLPLWISKEQIARDITQVENTLFAQDPSTLEIVAKANNTISEIKSNDQALFLNLSQYINDAAANLEAANEELSHIKSRMSFEPETLEELLSAKAKLKKQMSKHKCCDINGLKAAAQKLEKEVSALENSDVEETSLKNRVRSSRITLTKLSSKLKAERTKAAKKLSSYMLSELKDLGMDKASFSIDVDDAVKFMFAPNPGEGFRELSSIASGGESARVMLALKVIEARKNIAKNRDLDASILIFDEIDEGVSPQITNKIGNKLKEVSKTHQIFAITHSPALAGFANLHWLVEKSYTKGRTTAILKSLKDFDERKEEMLRLLGASSAKDKEKLDTYAKSLLKEKQN